MNCTTFVGLDVHKETISVAVARPGRGEPESVGVILNDSVAVMKLVKRMGSPEKLMFCYEAGPCGYGLYRLLTKLGATCVVAAPSLVPQRVGDRVKTDRKDAIKLARALRNGDLAPVWVPDEDQEALRDLVRAREDAKEDLQRKRHQLGKFLLRLDVRPPAGVRNWGSRHKQWLQALKLKHKSQQSVLCEYLHAIEEAESRIARLEAELVELVKTSKQKDVIEALQGLKGVSLVTAATIVAEAGDISRFHSPRQLMSYVGLVPSERSSGTTQRRGAITKCGNSHIRRVIVESAWHYRHRPAVGAALKKRQEYLPESVKQISWKAQHRLNLKHRRLVGRGKPSQVAVVAVARELLGFVWAIAQELRVNQQMAA